MKSLFHKLKVKLGLSDKHCGHCGSEMVIPSGYRLLICKECWKITYFEHGHAGIDGYDFEEERNN